MLRLEMIFQISVGACSAEWSTACECRPMILLSASGCCFVTTCLIVRAGPALAKPLQAEGSTWILTCTGHNPFRPPAWANLPVSPDGLPYGAKDGSSSLRWLVDGEGASWKTRLKLLVPVVIIGTGIQLAAHAAPDQLLNGLVAAALFNLIYDALLARGLRAYTLCPFIDFMNHSSTAGVRDFFLAPLVCIGHECSTVLHDVSS